MEKKRYNDDWTAGGHVQCSTVDTCFSYTRRLGWSKVTLPATCRLKRSLARDPAFSVPKAELMRESEEREERVEPVERKEARKKLGLIRLWGHFIGQFGVLCLIPTILYHIFLLRGI
jgi:hypothetical protein